MYWLIFPLCVILIICLMAWRDKQIADKVVMVPRNKIKKPDMLQYYIDMGEEPPDEVEVILPPSGSYEDDFEIVYENGEWHCSER